MLNAIRKRLIHLGLISPDPFAALNDLDKKLLRWLDFRGGFFIRPGRMTDMPKAIHII